MKKYLFNVNIPAAEWLQIYQGQVSQVMVRATCGTRIQLPARHFRAHVQRMGLIGWFELVLDQQNQVTSLQRVAVNKV